MIDSFEEKEKHLTNAMYALECVQKISKMQREELCVLKNTSVQSQSRELTAKIEKLTSANVAQLDELNKQKAVIKQKDTREMELKKKLASSFQSSDDLKKNLKDKTTELNQVKEEFEKYRIKYVAVDKESATKINDLQKKEEELLEKLKNQDSQLTTLQCNYNDAKKQSLSLLKINSNLKEQIMELEKTEQRNDCAKYTVVIKNFHWLENEHSLKREIMRNFGRIYAFHIATDPNKPNKTKALCQFDNENQVRKAIERGYFLLNGSNVSVQIAKEDIVAT